MRKGAIEMDNLTALILVLFAFIMVALLFGFVVNAVMDRRLDLQCGISNAVRQFADTAVPGPGLGKNLFGLSCPRSYLHVDDTPTQLFREWFTTLGKNSKYFWQYSAADPKTGQNEVKTQVAFRDGDLYYEDLQRIIAYEMGDCWWKFGEGTVDIMASYNKVLVGNTCIVCSEIHLARQGLDDRNLRMTAYLQNHNRPEYDLEGVDLRAQSYYDYLYTDRVESRSKTCLEKTEMVTALEQVKATSDTGYMIVLNRRGSKTVTALSVLIPGLQWCQTVGVIPTQQAYTYCDLIVN